ncbi:hypothetical protein HOY82DRAFT_596683 [Tuber indicum]|nr:hypothetical protein HOY82DRAFT_596683 [Tuber indicum]
MAYGESLAVPLGIYEARRLSKCLDYKDQVGFTLAWPGLTVYLPAIREPALPPANTALNNPPYKFRKVKSMVRKIVNKDRANGALKYPSAIAVVMSYPGRHHGSNAPRIPCSAVDYYSAISALALLSHIGISTTI